MKFFAKIKQKLDFLKKIIIVIVLLFSVNVAAPKPVEASASSIFSTILTPVMDLLVNIGDGIMDKLHELMVGQESSIIPIEKEGINIWKWIATLVMVVLVVAAVIIAVVGTAALASAIIPGLTLAASSVVTRRSNNGSSRCRSICRILCIYC